jgi:hypothetical protein
MQLQLAQAGQDRGPYLPRVARGASGGDGESGILMADASDLLGWGFGMLCPISSSTTSCILGWEIPVLGDVDVPPEVPYRMATFGVSGQAHYHALGGFWRLSKTVPRFVKIKSVSLQSLTPGIGGVVRGWMTSSNSGFDGIPGSSRRPTACGDHPMRAVGPVDPREPGSPHIAPTSTAALSAKTHQMCGLDVPQSTGGIAETLEVLNCRSGRPCRETGCWPGSAGV